MHKQLPIGGDLKALCRLQQALVQPKTCAVLSKHNACLIEEGEAHVLHATHCIMIGHC